VFPIGRIELARFVAAAVALQTNVYIPLAADTGDYATDLQFARNELIPNKKGTARNGMQLASRDHGKAGTGVERSRRILRGKT
jgi:hypothetical protein